MTSLIRWLGEGLHRLVRVALIALVAHGAAFAQEAPNVCQRAPNGALASISPIVKTSAQPGGSTLFESRFEFDPVPGVRKYTLSIVEFSVNSVPPVLGIVQSIDLDRLPAGNDPWQLNLRDGKIGRLNFNASVFGDFIPATAAFYAAITGRAEIRCGDVREGLEIANLRFQPGIPFPGAFGTLRGTVTNVGQSAVTGIDFSFQSTPEIRVHELAQIGLDPALSPVIATLDAGATREFLVPMQLQGNVGDLKRYNIDVRMTGTSAASGPVSVSASTSNTLDLSFYYPLDQIKQLLFGSLTALTNLVDSYAQAFTIGGIKAGAAEGVLNAMQELGDGILAVDSLLSDLEDPVEVVKLSIKGQAMAQAIAEYATTRSSKQMARDAASAGYAGVAGVGQALADWTGQLASAYERGDVREVTRMLVKPGTELAAGVGVEKVVAKILGKLIPDKVPRGPVRGLKKGSDAPDAGSPDAEFEQWARDSLDDFKDYPTGVPLGLDAIEKSGLNEAQHAYARNVAIKYRDHDVMVFVRPRTKEALKWQNLGYNAKPMPVKLKSMNEIDCDWLGFCEAGLAGKEGLVFLREPTNPFEKIGAAIRERLLKVGDPKIQEIWERYNDQRAKWDAHLQNDYVAKLNAENGGQGIKVLKNGKSILTKVSRDPDGLLRFDHDGAPVFSDVDLLMIARSDGSALPKEIHQQVMKDLVEVFDLQHGDGVMTSDFPSFDAAKKWPLEYFEEHQRGGTPVLAIGGQNTTAAYMRSISSPLPGAPIPKEAKDYDLYGLFPATMEGAGALLPAPR